MANKRKIGIFGGSFNPVHNGHIRLSKLYKEALGLDLLLVVPTNIPPHKTPKFMASFEDRVNMLKLAFEDCDYVSVSDIESRLEGKNYTVLTLKKLKEIYPNDDFYLIIGGDMFLCFEKWREYQTLLSECTVCTMPREEGELELLCAYQFKLDPKKEHTIILKEKALSVSSTEVRNSINDLNKLKELIPTKVYDYLIDKDLYSND